MQKCVPSERQSQPSAPLFFVLPEHPPECGLLSPPQIDFYLFP